MNDETNHPIRPEDLVAHAEGRLPAGSELRARVEEHLHHHPGDAARVEAYRRQDELLHETFDAVAGEPLPQRLQERLWHPRQARPRLALAASLLLGIAVGWLVAQIEFASEDVDSLAERTSEILGNEPSKSAGEAVTLNAVDEPLLPESAITPDLSRLGLTATGNTALADAGAGLQRHEYRDGDGNVVQLLITRDPMVNPESVYTLRNGDYTLAYWHRGENTYLLSGRIGTDRLQALAHRAMTALEEQGLSPAGDESPTESGVVAGNGNEGGSGDTATIEDPGSPTPTIDQM